MVAQAGPAGPINYAEIYTAIRRTVGSVFSQCSAYRVYMPSFGTSWGFVVGGGEDAPLVEALAPEEIDARLAVRLPASLRYYDGIAHGGMFALPRYLRQAFAGEERLITMESPLYAT